MPKRNLAWILIITMITLLMWQLPQIIAGRDAVFQAFGPLVDARSQIRRRFVEEVDDARITRAAVEKGIQAMVGELHDDFAIYLNPEEYERFKGRTDGVFGGIGVDVSMVDAGLEVLSRTHDSPAARAGILPGDIITHVDGESIAGLTLVEAVNRLNGAPDTTATLLVHRPSEGAAIRELKVERTVIHIEPVRGWSRSARGGWRFMLDPDLRIACIRLTKFTSDVDERLDQEIERLLSANIRGLILDLRDNTGGLLDSAREVADRFLESGLIVRVSGRKTDEKKWEAMREGTYPPIPMVVLVNESTASAAEIVAGALRDNGRALLVGERTYGKGSIQELIELDRHSGAVKLTTAFYYLPSGQCIHKTAKAAEDGTWGVSPTIRVPLSAEDRARLLAVWRELGRELLAGGATQPASGPDADRPPSEEAADLERRAAAAKLIAADPQLARAVSMLKRQIQPASAPARAD